MARKRDTYKRCVRRIIEKTGDKKKAVEVCKSKFGR